MKKLALILFTIVTLVSCKKDGYEISGTAKGIENGKKVFLEVPDETGQMVALDTTVITDGSFKIEGKLLNGIELGFLKFEENGSIPFILENGDINITFVKDSTQNSIVGGSKNNDYFQTFNELNKSITKKVIKFQTDNQDAYMQAMQAQDTATVNSLRSKLNEYQEEMNVSSLNFAKENKDSFISVLLLKNLLNIAYIPVEEISEHFNKLDKSVLETKEGQKILKVLKTLTKVAIGKKAPGFSAKNPEGKEISLKESLGKVTIIDFWASWCGPCRAENPNVVALYNQYHEKGLNIIGVSLDKENDAEKWKEAIEKDGLTWPQISNLKHWKEPIADLYSVKSIPATFILDANGIIVAKNLRGEELKAKVEELLAK